MTVEDMPTPDEEPQHEYGSRFFAMGEEPYCVWDWDLTQRNLEYLESLDPDYFDYVGRANVPHLEADDSKERRRAATAIRAAYHHGLESFFALLFATLQAPFCVVGWMQVYSPAELRELVRAVDPSLWGRDERRKQVRAYRDHLLPYVWVRPRSFLYWEGISKAIHRPAGNEEDVKKTRELFATLWGRFAKDLVNDAFISEYNSIKHGLRTGFGGFYMAIGPEAVAGEPVPPEAMHSLGGSEHGSSFFMPRTFVEYPREKDKRPRLGHGRNRQSHFRLRRQALNWDPKGLCDALTLITASIYNVRTFLLWVNRADPAGLRFCVPDEEVFSSPLGRPSGIRSSDMDAAVLNSDVRLLEREELEAEVKQEISHLRERLDPSDQPD
jgi:hypothetical protein